MDLRYWSTKEGMQQKFPTADIFVPYIIGIRVNFHNCSFHIVMSTIGGFEHLQSYFISCKHVWGVILFSILYCLALFSLLYGIDFEFLHKFPSSIASSKVSFNTVRFLTLCFYKSIFIYSYLKLKFFVVTFSLK